MLRVPASDARDCRLRTLRVRAAKDQRRNSPAGDDWKMIVDQKELISVDDGLPDSSQSATGSIDEVGRAAVDGGLPGWALGVERVAYLSLDGLA